MDCSLPGSSVHGIFQARVLEWGTIAFSFYSLYVTKRKKFAVRYEDPSHHQWASHPESSSDRVTQTVCLQRWWDAYLEWSTHAQPHSDIVACTQTGGWNLKGLKPPTQHFCPLHCRQHRLSSPTASSPLCNDQLSGKKVKRACGTTSHLLFSFWNCTSDRDLNPQSSNWNCTTCLTTWWSLGYGLLHKEFSKQQSDIKEVDLLI